ncbi:MAG: hypothetical protein HY672_03055 [Chloroflexi bacterium]|nr:hypothetical protein [Chloroflexota bacterium]
MKRRPLWTALGLLLMGASVVLVAGTSAEGFWWGQAAAADGDGGSTIPIPPPLRPTPRTSTVTPSETSAPLGVFLDVTLANLGLHVLSEATPSVGPRVVLPFPLESGSGMDWQAAEPPNDGGVLTVSLSSGPVAGDLKITLGPPQTNGQEATAEVVRVVLSVGPVPVKKAREQSWTARLEAELSQLPARVVMDVHGIPTDSDMVAALNEATSTKGMRVLDIAHAIKIDTNLAKVTSSADVEMAVEQGWAERWPRDRVVIARIGQDGRGRILETTRLAENASSLALFRAESGEGFSTFVLMALGETRAGESGFGPSVALWLGIGLGAAGLAGLATGVLILAFSRRRKGGA